MVYGTQITIVTGANLNQLITGGPHIVGISPIIRHAHITHIAIKLESPRSAMSRVQNRNGRADSFSCMPTTSLHIFFFTATSNNKDSMVESYQTCQTCLIYFLHVLSFWVWPFPLISSKSTGPHYPFVALSPAPSEFLSNHGVRIPSVKGASKIPKSMDWHVLEVPFGKLA